MLSYFGTWTRKVVSTLFASHPLPLVCEPILTSLYWIDGGNWWKGWRTDAVIIGDCHFWKSFLSLQWGDASLPLPRYLLLADVGHTAWASPIATNWGHQSSSCIWGHQSSACVWTWINWCCCQYIVACTQAQLTPCTFFTQSGAFSHTAESSPYCSPVRSWMEALPPHTPHDKLFHRVKSIGMLGCHQTKIPWSKKCICALQAVSWRNHHYNLHRYSTCSICHLCLCFEPPPLSSHCWPTYSAGEDVGQQCRVLCLLSEQCKVLVQSA